MCDFILHCTPFLFSLIIKVSLMLPPWIIYSWALMSYCTLPPNPCTGTLEPTLRIKFWKPDHKALKYLYSETLHPHLRLNLNHKSSFIDPSKILNPPLILNPKSYFLNDKIIIFSRLMWGRTVRQGRCRGEGSTRLGSRFYGVRFRVEGVGFGVWGLGFRV